MDCERDVEQDSVETLYFQNGFDIFRLCRIGSGANENADRVLSEHDVENKVGDQSEDDNPEIQKQNPKFVVKCCRIFQPKDEQKSSDGNGSEEEVKVGSEAKSQIVIRLTYERRQRSYDVPVNWIEKTAQSLH